MISHPGFRRCFACGTSHRVTDVLAVVDPSGRRRYVCRPTLRPPCFRYVKSSERIERPGDPRNAA